MIVGWGESCSTSTSGNEWSVCFLSAQWQWGLSLSSTHSHGINDRNDWSASNILRKEATAVLWWVVRVLERGQEWLVWCDTTSKLKTKKFDTDTTSVAEGIKDWYRIRIVVPKQEQLMVMRYSGLRRTIGNTRYQCGSNNNMKALW